MITRIDIPQAMWLIAPGQRYLWGGGQSGPYGDTLDAVRLEMRGPEGEPLLTKKPDESDVIRAAILNCGTYPSIINWAALRSTLSVYATPGVIAAGEQAAIELDTASSFIVLQDRDGIDSVTEYTRDTLQFTANIAGTYTIHVFDSTTFTYGRVEVVVT